MNLMLETIEQAAAALVAHHRPVIGVAMSPQTKALLDRSAARWSYTEFDPTGNFVTFCGATILIDPRMSVKVSEAYYDREAWLSRCREQNEWEASRLTPPPAAP